MVVSSEGTEVEPALAPVGTELAGTELEGAGLDSPEPGAVSVGLTPVVDDPAGLVAAGPDGVVSPPLGRVVKLAVHLVQTVEVEVTTTVEIVLVVITVVEEPELTVLVTGHSVVVV